ncbi:MAG: cyclic nucleotide-binding domain-containing protein [Pseudomonadota bacterium]
MSVKHTYLTDDDLSLLEQHGEVVDYAPQDNVLQQDTQSDRIYYLRSGMVQVDFSRVYNTDVLAYVGEGEFVGEVSFLDHQESSASVTAVKPVQMLELTRDDMEKLLESDPALAARFYHTVATTLARRIRASNAQ